MDKDAGRGVLPSVIWRFASVTNSTGLSRWMGGKTPPSYTMYMHVTIPDSIMQTSKRRSTGAKHPTSVRQPELHLPTGHTVEYPRALIVVSRVDAGIHPPVDGEMST